MDREADLDNVALHGLRPVRREISYHRKRQLIMSNEPIGWRRPSGAMGEFNFFLGLSRRRLLPSMYFEVLLFRE